MVPNDAPAGAASEAAAGGTTAAVGESYAFAVDASALPSVRPKP